VSGSGSVKGVEEVESPVRDNYIKENNVIFLCIGQLLCCVAIVGQINLVGLLFKTFLDKGSLSSITSSLIIAVFW